MTEALDLSEEQTAKLFPPLTRLEKEKAELQRRLGLEVRDLRTDLEREPIREQDVLAAVKRVRELRQAVRQKDEEIDAVIFDAGGTLIEIQSKTGAADLSAIRSTSCALFTM